MGAAGDGDVVIEPGGAVSPAALPHDRAVTLEGSFDQPDAINCDVSQSEDRVLEHLGCRSVFVVSHATPEEYFLSPGTAAITITDNLRVRSLPVVADTSKRLELLDNGTRMFVLDGPVVASGYTWYQVAVPAIRPVGGQPRVGWVAIGSKNGEQWAGWRNSTARRRAS